MLLFSKFKRYRILPRAGTFVIKAKNDDDGLKSVTLSMVIGCILSQARLDKTVIGDVKGQSAWSEYMGFNPRLLSKYEAGAISLTINHLSYISYYLDVELPVFQEILKSLVLYLAEHHDIYVHLDIDSLPITGEGFERNNLNDLSYICLYKWLNLDIAFSTRKKIYFDCPNKVNIYELKNCVDNFFNEEPFVSFKNSHRENLFKSISEKLKNFYYSKLSNAKDSDFIQIQNEYKDDENILYEARQSKDSRYHEISNDESYNRPTQTGEIIQTEYQNQDVIESKKLHTIDEKRLDILVLSSDKTYQLPMLDELSDKKISIRKLNHVSLKLKSEIAILVAKNIEEINQCNFDLYKVSFLVIEHNLDISSCIHKLSNVIVYRKNNNNEKTDKVLNLLFQSIILSFYTKEYDGLFLDYEDLNSALSFQTNRYLKIEEIKEIENMSNNIFEHMKNNGSFVILHKSKHSVKDLKLALQEFERITDLFDEDSDCELFFGVSFDNEIIEDKFFIAYSTSNI
jgi:transcriptional regulator with XRE-family HTH domain